MVLPTLPGKIDPRLFAPAGMNGQLSTEAQALVVRATLVLHNGRAVTDNRQLRQAFLVLFHYWRFMRCPAALFLPLLGTAEGLIERGGD